ncbi:MAG: FHA domain-containing protein [Anaerolineaceae bacterium]
MLRHLFWLLALSLFFTVPVNSQTANNAILYLPDTSAFPAVGLYLDVHNAKGNFIHGIRMDDVQVFEDDRQVQINEFKELRPGVQMVIALNPGHSFLVRNAKGQSRYDILASSLTDWAASRTGSNLDDISFIVPDSPGRTHLSNPLDLAQAASAYIVNDKTMSPNIDIISNAIDLANDSPPRAGMKRAILLFTSPLENDASLGIQDLVTRAAQNHIRIFIWLIGSPDTFNEKNTANLESLATQTGGAIIPYSTDEMAINLEDYLDPLRSVYYIKYNSQTRETGTHQLSAKIQYNGEEITTPLQNFEIKLKPPKPAFILPPTSISRTAPAAENQNITSGIQAKDYLPKEIQLRILVEFPDERPRNLVRSTLYIDQVKVKETLKPPFDQFTWDISKYPETSQHLICVEVEDELGLTGKTIETPVDIILPTPHRSLVSALSPHIPWITGVIVVSAGILLTFILLVNGKIHPASQGWLKNYQKAKRDRNKIKITTKSLDPFDSMGYHKTGQADYVQEAPSPTPPVLAYLLPISDNESKQNIAPIPITKEQFIIGRDNLLASLILDNPTIEPEHACITYRKDHQFFLTDQGTRAGTWVNYMPVSEEGIILEQGDLIHFGNVTFRFSQPEHGKHKKIVVQEALEYDPF